MRANPDNLLPRPHLSSIGVSQIPHSRRSHHAKSLMNANYLSAGLSRSASIMARGGARRARPSHHRPQPAAPAPATAAPPLPTSASEQLVSGGIRVELATGDLPRPL